MKIDTRDAAHGRWIGILHRLLSPLQAAAAMRRKQGPCPICGGKERYRYDDKYGHGNWFCNVCGAGDGFHLLMRIQGWDFARCANEVDRIVNSIVAEPFQPEIDVEKRRAALNAMWQKATKSYMVAEYLGSRGLSWDAIKEYTGDLRGTTDLKDVDHNDALRAGMVALMRDAHGNPVSIHRTFFKTTEWEAVKKIMPPIESVVGAVIRLGEAESKLVIGEGIETTLAGCQLFGCPGVATVSANNMVEYRPPGTVQRAIILADNDESFTGQSVAFQLAHKLANLRKMKVQVVMPRGPGADMNDHLRLSPDDGLLTWGSAA